MRLILFAVMLACSGCASMMMNTSTTRQDLEAIVCLGFCQQVEAGHEAEVGVEPIRPVPPTVQPQTSTEESAPEAEAVEIPLIAPHLQDFDTGDGCSKETPEFC